MMASGLQREKMASLPRLLQEMARRQGHLGRRLLQKMARLQGLLRRWWLLLMIL